MLFISERGATEHAEAAIAAGEATSYRLVRQTRIAADRTGVSGVLAIMFNGRDCLGALQVSA